MAAPAAPAAGAGIEAIAAFGLILSFAVCWALRQVWVATLGWLMHKLADLIDFSISIPIKGSIRPLEGAANAIRAASDNVSNALGYLALKSENGAVWLFHQAAQQLRWMAAEIAGLAEDVWKGIDHIETRVIPQAIRLGAKQVQRRLRGIEATLGRFEHAFARRLHGIDALLKRLEHTLTHTLPHELHAIRSRAGTTSKQLRRLARRTSRLEKTLAGAGIVAIVGTALSRLGLRWLRCPQVGKFGKRICGANPSWLEDFFTGMLLVTGTVSLVELIKDLQSVEEEALDALDLFVRDIGPFVSRAAYHAAHPDH